eukprot:TRINITY_DN7262_c3_g1_i1.p1 TRINITY_DN7262_c3_g1~~TRINITY_DN7262_c3_g1_i1.p1  ORF type:complete len:226 (+),score=31.93 TRINITY_DN7262_c3_g1_i1:71-748(+)
MASAERVYKEFAPHLGADVVRDVLASVGLEGSVAKLEELAGVRSRIRKAASPASSREGPAAKRPRRSAAPPALPREVELQAVRVITAADASGDAASAKSARAIRELFQTSRTHRRAMVEYCHKHNLLVAANTQFARHLLKRLLSSLHSTHKLAAGARAVLAATEKLANAEPHTEPHSIRVGAKTLCCRGQCCCTRGRTRTRAGLVHPSWCPRSGRCLSTSPAALR